MESVQSQRKWGADFLEAKENFQKENSLLEGNVERLFRWVQRTQEHLVKDPSLRGRGFYSGWPFYWQSGKYWTPSTTSSISLFFRYDHESIFVGRADWSSWYCLSPRCSGWRTFNCRKSRSNDWDQCEGNGACVGICRQEEKKQLSSHLPAKSMGSLAKFRFGKRMT